MHLLFVPALCSPCCSRKVVLICDDYRRLEDSEMYKGLRAWAQMLFRHEWRKLDTTSLLLPCFDNRTGVICSTEFCTICQSGCILILLRIVVLRKRLPMDSTSDLTTQKSFLKFLECKVPRFVNLISAWTQIVKNCSSDLVFSRHQIFSFLSLMGTLVCSSNVTVVSSHRIF